MTGKKISLTFFVGVLILLTGFVAEKAWAGMCLSSYCDSDTITVQTSAGPPPQPPVPSQPYTVSCQSYNSAIFVTWQGSSSTVQEVDLLRASGSNIFITPSGYITNPTATSSVWYAPQSQGGNYTYSDYPSAPGSYTYILRVMQSPTNFSYSNQTTCSIGGLQGPASSDAPSMVQAFANSPSTVYLNWKDNSTSTAGSYEFVVQRMRVTPNDPTSTSASAVESAPTQVSVNLGWADTMTSTVYYASIERSTSTYFATTTLYHYENNSQVPVLSKLTDTPYTPVLTSPKHTFSLSDASPADATTYYYRIRECSTLGLSGYYASSTLSGALLNSGPDGEPSVTCTWPSQAFSATTPPYAPTSLTASVNGTSEIDLSWTNNSQRASSIQILRDGSYLATVSSSTTSYPDAGLPSGTTHSYTVQAYYTGYDAVLKKNVTVYSNQSNSSSATTDFVVSVGINPSGGGSVTSNPSGVSCGNGGSCSASFSNGTQVVLNASPASGFTFNGWSGSCLGTGTCTVSGNANVTATFNSTAPQETLSVSVNPQSVGNVTVSPGSGFVTGSGSYTMSAGTQVTLTARSVVPSFTFTKWTGGACNNSTNSVCSFTINTSTQVTANFTRALSSSPNDFTASLANAASPVIDFMKNIASGFAADVARIAESVSSDFGRAIAFLITPSTVEGQTTPYDAYFVSVTTTTNPVVIDGGLSPDAVYVYRVKVHYTDGRVNPDSAWSTWAAVKTLMNTNPSSAAVSAPICTANSVCNQSVSGVQSNPTSSRDPQVERSERQCLTNADCINVGRINSIFQEK